MSSFDIRLATHSDGAAIWRIIEPVIRGGETYALPRQMHREEALGFWCGPHHTVFVAEMGDNVVGTYYLQQNQSGGGSHVANCGYITSHAHAGLGIAAAMCAHSLEYAKSSNFRAMQFNCVVSTNDRAVRLWQRFGFQIVGRLPEAFNHPEKGFVDAFVMHRVL